MKTKPTKFSAVFALVGGEISTSDYETFEYNSGQTPPTEEAIEEKLKELMTEFDGLEEYQRDRQYPPIGDQLDALYHAGVFPKEMADKLKAVKDAHPKPTE